jgi:hypothetical protein
MDLQNVALKIKDRYVDLNEQMKSQIKYLDNHRNKDPFEALASENPTVAADLIVNFDSDDRENGGPYRKCKFTELEQKLSANEKTKQEWNNLALLAVTGIVTVQPEVELVVAAAAVETAAKAVAETTAAQILSKLPSAALGIEDATVLLNSIQLGKLKELTRFQLEVGMSREELITLIKMLKDPKYIQLVKNKLQNYL